MTTRDPGKCQNLSQRGDRSFYCSRPAGHHKDGSECEATDGDSPENTRRALTFGPFAGDSVKSHAYAVGAIDYATGVGLDRLARDLRAPARAKSEGDFDLSQRLARLLGLLR